MTPCQQEYPLFISICKGQREKALALYKKMLLYWLSMCIHLQREAKWSFPFLLIYLLLTFHMAISINVPSSPQSIQDTLLRLKQSFYNSSILSSWNTSQPPCLGSKSNWVGVICSIGGNVYAVRLENMGLSGKIDIDALLGLPKLRSISFVENEFGGPIPEIWKLRALKSVYLSKNNFEGVINPNAFDGLNRLEKVHLANNRFVGEIPTSLTMLPRLIELRLEGNRFQGSIPDFHGIYFDDISLANNQLEGPIPNILSSFSTSAFTGNKGLCGMPLNSCSPNSNPISPDSTPPSPSPLPLPPSPSSTKNSIPIISIIIAVAIVLLVVLIVIALTIRKRKPRRENRPRPGQGFSIQPKNPTRDIETGQNPHKKKTNLSKTKGEVGKLCFMRDDVESFDLPDLLKSSAEILGSGCFGASYKARLESSTMVVKRYKQMNTVGKEEFQEHMRRLGRLQHQNLLSLVAYYYKKEEKLLVSHYVENGSLAFHLHGNQREELTLDWPKRLKIIKGVARGLSYLYKELPSLISPHGHLKSSNVLLDESFNPSLNDYGLMPLINLENAHHFMVAYKSPEYISNGRINKKTDVWSLGILIIEIISGELPTDHYLQQGSRQVNLSSWVDKVVGENVGIQVFDKTMGLTQHSEGEIIKMLRIGLSCCESDIEKRWGIKEASERIEEVRERELNYDDDFYSSYASEGERGSSSREMSDEFAIVPMN